MRTLRAPGIALLAASLLSCSSSSAVSDVQRIDGTEGGTPFSFTGAGIGGDARTRIPVLGSEMMVPIVFILTNVSDRDQPVDRFTLRVLTPTEWNFDPVSVPLKKVVPEGEDLEVEAIVRLRGTPNRQDMRGSMGRRGLQIEGTLYHQDGIGYFYRVEIPANSLPTFGPPHPPPGP